MVLETNMLGYMSVGGCHKKEGCGKMGWDETKARNKFPRVGNVFIERVTRVAQPGGRSCRSPRRLGRSDIDAVLRQEQEQPLKWVFRNLKELGRHARLPPSSVRYRMQEISRMCLGLEFAEGHPS